MSNKCCLRIASTTTIWLVAIFTSAKSFGEAETLQWKPGLTGKAETLELRPGLPGEKGVKGEPVVQKLPFRGGDASKLTNDLNALMKDLTGVDKLEPGPKPLPEGLSKSLENDLQKVMEDLSKGKPSPADNFSKGLDNLLSKMEQSPKPGVDDIQPLSLKLQDDLSKKDLRDLFKGLTGKGAGLFFEKAKEGKSGTLFYYGDKGDIGVQSLSFFLKAGASPSPGSTPPPGTTPPGTTPPPETSPPPGTTPPETSPPNGETPPPGREPAGFESGCPDGYRKWGTDPEGRTLCTDCPPKSGTSAGQ